MLDFSKPLLSDGRQVRILCTDGPGEFPFVGVVGDQVCQWDEDGACLGHPTAWNLTQSPEPAKLQLREGRYYRHRDSLHSRGLCGESLRGLSTVGQMALS